MDQKKGENQVLGSITLFEGARGKETGQKTNEIKENRKLFPFGVRFVACSAGVHANWGKHKKSRKSQTKGEVGIERGKYSAERGGFREGILYQKKLQISLSGQWAK